jgi:glycosyltransferase involved in cell wall biosynthesis
MNKMKVDVVLLTMNLNKSIFAKVLESVYRNVDVNRLIVIDGGSTDGTIEFVSKFPRVKIHTDIGGTRASAREMGIRLVETKWFLFLDSDILLCKNWNKIIVGHAPDRHSPLPSLLQTGEQRRRS